jgi:L-lactate dehydrogenase complex protein LldE
MPDPEPNRPERPDAVYIFGTCLIDTLFPQAGLCAMRLLRRAGVRVIYPQDQTCCGQPAYNSGYRDEARRVARAQLAAFPLDLPIVVPSASCAGMLRVHYRELFAGAVEQARAEALSRRVYELTEFLVRVLDLKLEDLGAPVRVALHNSCSARREMGVADATTALLGRLAQVETVEPDRATECCGFGGTFSIKQPEISAAMTGDKADAIAATGAEVLVSQDCGCLMSLGGTFARRAETGGTGLRVMHIAEFLWSRTHDH